jgi:hypothetical protein
MYASIVKLSVRFSYYIVKVQRKQNICLPCLVLGSLDVLALTYFLTHIIGNPIEAANNLFFTASAQFMRKSDIDCEKLE